MTSYKSDFMRAVVERGYLHQCTDADALDAQASSGIVTAYIGFDATATSLHAGSLVPIMMLRTLQKTGHKPIVLMGGGTTKVGDPSGKDESRQMLTPAQIDANIAGIKGIFERYLSFGDGPTDAVMVNNDDWLSRLNYIDFLRDYGPHFTINRMMTFDSVKLRLEREQPLTFLEFNYMILQAYDFVELARRHKCVLQMGGSDQWGNIVNGVELGRRHLDGRQVLGDGAFLEGLARGLGRGQGGVLAVTQPGDLVGEDLLGLVDLGALGRFQLLDLGDRQLGEKPQKTPDVGVLGVAPVLPVVVRAEHVGVEPHRAGRGLAHLGAGRGGQQRRGQAEKTLVGDPAAELDAGIAAFDLLRRAGLAGSGGEARRLIKGGGGRVNDVPIKEDTQPVTTADINADGVIKLSAGKKRHVLVRLA